jgi:undecaprenyl-diphosphatase
MNAPKKSDSLNTGLTRSDAGPPRTVHSSRWTQLKAYIAAYFSPEGSLGLYLLIGFVVLLLSAALFSEIASDVTANEFIVRFDLAVESAIHANTNPGLIQMMLIASLAGSQVIIIAAVVIGALFIWRHNWHDLLLLVIAVGGEELINLAFKSAFNRPRPVFSDPITLANGFSFPSGHAMGSMVFYGLIAYFLMRRSKPILDRILIVLIGLLIIAIIGFSRIYLGLHYPSDVVGGYSAGLAWLAFTISGLGLYRGWRQHRHRRKQKRLASNQP